MVLNERQSEILDYLDNHTHASVCELSKKLFVSEMTIRRDLREMKLNGYIHRYHGGATRRLKNEILPFSSRKYLHIDKKLHIAEATRPYLQNGISVFIDSSTTCLYVLPLLKEYNNIQIITNSLSACLSAAKYNIPCKLAGGDVYGKDLCTVGTDTSDFLQKFNVDLAFFSLQAVSEDGKITDSNYDQISVRHTVLANCKKSIVLMDKEKQNNVCPYTFTTTSEVDVVIIL